MRKSTRLPSMAPFKYMSFTHHTAKNAAAAIPGSSAGNATASMSTRQSFGSLRRTTCDGARWREAGCAHDGFQGRVRGLARQIARDCAGIHQARRHIATSSKAEMAGRS